MNAAREIVVKRDAAASLGIDRDKLPQLYEAAKSALRECVAIDELKDIGDKHAAIELYAKQSKDESLLRYAQRIKLRAFEQIGVLLLEIPNEEERKALAARHGISVVTSRRAYQAAHTPKKVRDRMIEGTPIPSAKRLADVGDGYMPQPVRRWNPRFRRHVDTEESIKWPVAAQAAEVVRALVSIKQDLEYIASDNCGTRYTFTQLGAAVDPDEVNGARSLIRDVFSMIENFRQALPKVARPVLP